MGRFVILAIALAACGGDDAGPSGSTRDAPAVDTPSGGGPCQSGQVDVLWAWPVTPSGNLMLSGMITLPGTLIAGKSVRIELTEIQQGVTNTPPAFTFAEPKTAITYRVTGSLDHSWKVCLRADLDGDGKFMTGDWGGCYDGTTAAPIYDKAQAKEIMLSGACRSGLDFGLGVIP